MLAVSMPNSATFSVYVDTATKCLAMALASPPRPWSAQLGALRCTQRDVQDCAIFRHVDFLASKHRIDPGAQPGLFGEFDEQLESLVVDAIFRVIQVDAGGLRGHPLAACRIIGEQSSQVEA